MAVAVALVVVITCFKKNLFKSPLATRHVNYLKMAYILVATIIPIIRLCCGIESVRLRRTASQSFLLGIEPQQCIMTRF